MKAHLSPSHIQSRKRLHFFHGIANWTCSSQSSFLFPISPSSHGSSPYGSVVVLTQIYIFCATVLLAGSIFATRLFLLHQTVQADIHRKEAGTVHPFPPAETILGQDANHSKTSLLVENQHIEHDSNQTIAHQTGFQTPNFLSVPLQL